MPASPDHSLCFAGFRLDLRGERLFAGPREIVLRPRAWQLLVHLVQHHGVLVSTDELHELLWPNTAVTPKALTNLIVELRRALGDETEGARLLETVHRRGYRFNPEVTRVPAASAVTPALVALQQPALADAAPFVGRSQALQQLRQAWGAALSGRRQIVWLQGDAGIGKSELIDRFLAQLPAAQGLVARGQCAEQSGEREAFGAVLSLLGELCSGAGAALAVPLLRRYAPCWLLQLPWLHQTNEAAQLRLALGGSGAGRMLRECGSLLEALSAQVPLLLVIEDLHWADGATLDLLVQLAAARAPARLMLLASLRPQAEAESAAPDVAWTRLQALPHSLSIALPPLGRAEVADYLRQRFGAAAWQERLLLPLTRRCAGNPLFLAATLDHLQERGLLRRHADGWELDPALDEPELEHLMPPRLLALLAQRLKRLEPGTRQVLEAASAIGRHFAMPLLAAAVGGSPLEVEQICAVLAQHQLFIQPAAPQRWADGREVSVYAFVHDLYRQALYEGLAPGRRRQLHEVVARRLEADHGSSAPAVAGEAAAAYVAAGLHADAVRVLQLAAGVAAQRFAYEEAAAALQAALQQLALLPDTPQRARDALYVHLTLASVVMTGRGLTQPRVLESYERADALARRDGTTMELVRARLGVCMGAILAGRFSRARVLGQEAVALAEASHPPLLAMACTYAGLAESGCAGLPAARGLFQRALTLQPAPGLPLFIDVHTMATFHLGRVMCLAGAVGPGLVQVAEAHRRAHDAAVPFDRIQTLHHVADWWHLMGQHQAARALYLEVLEQAQHHAMSFHALVARVMVWGLEQPAQPLPADLAGALDDLPGRGDAWGTARLRLFLADALRERGQAQAAWQQLEAAQALLDDCAMLQTLALQTRAELMTLTEGAESPAVQALWAQGLALARQQGAALLQLRLAVARQRGLVHAGRAESGLAGLAAACAAVQDPGRPGDLADWAEAQAMLQAHARKTLSL